MATKAPQQKVTAEPPGDSGAPGGPFQKVPGNQSSAKRARSVAGQVERKEPLTPGELAAGPPRSRTLPPAPCTKEKWPHAPF